MAPVSPRANIVCGSVIAALAAFSVLVIAGPIAIISAPYASDQLAPNVEPATFDHRHHVRAIDCEYCHHAAESSPYGVCIGCHGQVWSDGVSVRPAFTTR